MKNNYLNIKKTLFVFLVFFVSINLNAQIFSNPITGTNPSSNNPYTNGQTVASNISVSGIGRSNALTAFNVNNMYAATGWTTNNSINTNQYFEFTLTPNSCYEIDFTQFSYVDYVGSYGPTRAAVRSSVDNYASNIVAYNINTNFTSGTIIVPLNAAAFQNITAPITFRIYAWKASDPSYTYRIDSFAFYGSVNTITPPAIPTISTTAATCATAGTATISNYNSLHTYTFSPTGPTAGAGGAISGMTAGTNYTVTATNGSCTSSTSPSFSIGAQLTTPAAPTSGTITQPTCSTATGSVVLNGLPASGTWTLNRTGTSSATTTGTGTSTTISGLAQGTYNFTVTNASGCTSAALNGVVINAQPATPSIPAITATAANCAASGTATITNYSGVNTYAFSPSGPTVGAGGSISGFTLGQPYTVTANNGFCTSGSSLSFTVTDDSSTTWNGSTWSNGTPTLTKNAVVTGDYDMVANGALPNISACRMTVVSPARVVVKTNAVVTLQNELTVNPGASFVIRNSGSLVQINDTPSPANSGSVSMDRTATNLKLYDYIYWSSPVENFAVTSVSPLTPTSKIYHWVTDHNNGAGYGYGNWLNVNENMVAGKGYIVRVPNGNTSFSTTFTGKPLNGVITKGVARGSYVGGDYLGTNGTITTYDDNWNLVGNPYPSAIDAIEFLAANNGIIEGEVNLWTHSSAISTANPSPYYQTFGYNYKSDDYVTYNGSGNNIGATTGFNGKIAAGQGFFVKMIDGAAGSGNITFNNSMRTDGSNNAYNNGQFYRTSSQQTATTEPEKHRIWLDLIDSNMNTSRFMAGYIQGATNDKDHLYDARTNYTESLKAFTMVDQSDDIFVIQGRSLPFDSSDKINFGIQVPANATYKIAIADVDGLFKTEGQKIYVEDLLTNTTHDLTLSPYSFTSDKGIFKNRFVIKFNDQKLSNTENEFSNSVTVFGKEQLTVKSELFSIKDVTFYDVLGKTLLHAKDIAEKEYQANVLRPTNSVILVKATLENGAIVTKKVIF